MVFNYDIMLCGFIGMVNTFIILFLFKFMIKKTSLDSEVSNKMINAIFRGLYDGVWVFWIGFIIIMTALNPIVHNSDQEPVGSDVMEMEMTKEINTSDVKAEGKIKIKERDDKIYDELKETDEQSSDDYEDFLKANRQ